MRNRLAMLVMIAVVVCGSTIQAETTIDVMAATPAGSWQEREVTTTDSRGRTSLGVIRVKHLGEEERRGETYIWVETETQSYKVKKNGDRKPEGDLMVMKALVPKKVLEGDFQNIMSNLTSLGEEVLIQTGDAQPMKLSGAGGLMQGAAQATNLQISYDYQKTGSGDVQVPAGSFSCTTYAGSGEATMDLVFKKMKVESKAKMWVSDEVPFGLVKSTSEDLVDGQKQTSEAVLTAHGSSGATSKITGEPVEMPSIPGLFGGR